MLLMSSRRTINSGEVVTFATEFEAWDSVFGKAYRAKGLIEVSASRDSIIVHRGESNTDEQSQELMEALRQAEAVRRNLAPHWRGGRASQYPEEPTPCNPPPDQPIANNDPA